MISHVVVLSHFRHKPHLYDHHVIALSSFHDKPHFFSIGHNTLVLISTYVAPIRLVMSLSYLDFIMDRTLLD